MADEMSSTITALEMSTALAAGDRKDEVRALRLEPGKKVRKAMRRARQQ